jgi:hypothetical protein
MLHGEITAIYFNIYEKIRITLSELPYFSLHSAQNGNQSIHPPFSLQVIASVSELTSLLLLGRTTNEANFSKYAQTSVSWQSGTCGDAADSKTSPIQKI